MSGPPFLTSLPPGFDDRATMHLNAANKIVIVHPEHSPRYLEESAGQWVEIDGAETEGGEM